MSSTPETPSTPSHWETAHDTDPVPVELLEPPRYRCSEDGTRVYSLADIAAHDEQFHAKSDSEAGRPEPEIDYVRVEALTQATRIANGRDTQEQLVERAHAFEVFLRGGSPSGERSYPVVDGPHLVLGPECFTGDGDEVDQTVISWRGQNYYLPQVLGKVEQVAAPGDLGVLERLLGFIRERTFEDASGLRSLEGQAPQDEAESFLVDLSHEELRMMAHVIAVASTLVRAAERKKR